MTLLPVALPDMTALLGCPATASHAHPMVSIVIPCRNERNHIGRCLDSILANDYPLDRLEILVAEGMSDDGTRQVVEQYAIRHPAVRIIPNPKRIVSAALNIGIAQATGEVIMRMDAHDEYPANYISALVGWLQRTGADNVGAARITRPASDRPAARAIAIALSHPFGIGNARFRLGTTELRRVDTVPFGCFRKALCRQIGLFDEELVRNQDEEFCFRLIRAGGTVLLVPGVVSYYYARHSLRQLARMYYQYGYFKPLVARKIGRIMTLRQLIPPLFVSGVITTGLLASSITAARLVLVLLLSAYLAANVACSTVVLLRRGVDVGLAVAAAFVVLHVSYGLGFLRGVLDFLVLRRPGGGSVPLSR
jgi:glycosyltransferase involved in cell wall biosynthesis